MASVPAGSTIPARDLRREGAKIPEVDEIKLRMPSSSPSTFALSSSIAFRRTFLALAAH